MPEMISIITIYVQSGKDKSENIITLTLLNWWTFEHTVAAKYTAITRF